MPETADERKRQVRCLHCFGRIVVPKGVDQYSCPKCGIAWRISWHPNGMPKIRGPVWSELRKTIKEQKT